MNMYVYGTLQGSVEHSLNNTVLDSGTRSADEWREHEFRNKKLPHYLFLFLFTIAVGTLSRKIQQYRGNVCIDSKLQGVLRRNRHQQARIGMSEAFERDYLWLWQAAVETKILWHRKNQNHRQHLYACFGSQSRKRGHRRTSKTPVSSFIIYSNKRKILIFPRFILRANSVYSYF